MYVIIPFSGGFHDEYITKRISVLHIFVLNSRTVDFIEKFPYIGIGFDQLQSFVLQNYVEIF